MDGSRSLRKRKTPSAEEEEMTEIGCEREGREAMEAEMEEMWWSLKPVSKTLILRWARLGLMHKELLGFI